jgi:hypothetical protein
MIRYRPVPEGCLSRSGLFMERTLFDIRMRDYHLDLAGDRMVTLIETTIVNGVGQNPLD